MRSDNKNIEPRQSLLDLAVQYYGAPEGVLDLLKSGQFDSFTSQTDSSQKVSIGEAVEPDVVRFFESKKVAPATFEQVQTTTAFSGGFSIGFE